MCIDTFPANTLFFFSKVILDGKHKTYFICCSLIESTARDTLNKVSSMVENMIKEK